MTTQAVAGELSIKNSVRVLMWKYCSQHGIRVLQGIFLEGQKAGHLGTPGGGVDEGETPVQAAAREGYEETGILIDENELVELCTLMADVPASDGRPVRITYYAVEVGPGAEATDNDEMADLAFRPVFLLPDAYPSMMPTERRMWRDYGEGYFVPLFRNAQNEMAKAA